MDIDRDKTQERQIQSIESVIRDGVAERDYLNGLTIRELVEGIVSWTERQEDG